MGNREFKLVYDGGIHVIAEDKAITFEVVDGGDRVFLKLWQLYKDAEGDWNYCSPQGGRGILIALDPKTVEFIEFNLGKVKAAAAKVAETKATTAKKATKQVKQAKQVTTQQQQTVKVGDTEIVLTPELMNQLLATQAKAKSSKKK